MSATLREAAQQALEALEGELPDWRTPAQARAVIALRDALAQEREQEQEPVAWTTMPHADDWLFVSGAVKPSLLGEWQPLYTHPPRREWQGLTTQEAMALTDTAPKGVFYGCDAGTGLGIWIAAVAAAERALKEKNHG